MTFPNFCKFFLRKDLLRNATGTTSILFERTSFFLNQEKLRTEVALTNSELELELG